MEPNPYPSEYSAHLDPVSTLLKSLDRADRRGLEHGLHPDPHQRADYTKRGVVADALSERGREPEAELLRSPHPVNVENGAVKADYWHHQEGYPIYYTLPHLNPKHSEWGMQYVDNDPLCHHCINDNANSDPHGTPVFEQHPHWEGPPIECTHCGREIESAYGDPHAEEGE